MAWEKRKGKSGLYYTRTHRTAGGRRIRVYFGCGPIAELASVVDDRHRVEREISRRRREAGIEISDYDFTMERRHSDGDTKGKTG